METSPVVLSVETPERIARWRPLVHGILAIPHYIVLWVLGMVSGVVGFISFFTILFTRAIPEGLFGAQVMVMRYQWRVGSYVSFLHETYPPFGFETAVDDPGGYPATLSVAAPTEPFSRLLPLVKWLLAIPHMVVLFFVGIGAGIAMFIAFFAVLFTGRFPAGIQRFVVGTQRWGMRVNAYLFLLTDQYPPFSLD